MSLRRRLVLGLVAVAAVLIVTNVALSRTIEGFLLDRLDEQLVDVASRGSTDCIPRTAKRYRPATISTAAIRPTVSASSSAAPCPKPMARQRSISGPTIAFHASPPVKPSNDVVPMITQTSATVPGTIASVVRPASGGRR
ncbi:MAG: hypothetical protein KY433_06255 [Actinobacteria bacterium]|nr:hypothetical protein [Actinomycetota bacterium]